MKQAALEFLRRYPVGFRQAESGTPFRDDGGAQKRGSGGARIGGAEIPRSPH
jgi:hypothetical protein